MWVRACAGVCVCQPMAGLNSTSLIPARTCVRACVGVCVCVCVCACVCVCVCGWVGGWVGAAAVRADGRTDGRAVGVNRARGCAVPSVVVHFAKPRSRSALAALFLRRSRHPHGPSVRPSVRSHCGGVGVSTPPGGGVERRSFCGSEQVNDENYKLEIRGSSSLGGFRRTDARTPPARIGETPGSNCLFSNSFD